MRIAVPFWENRISPVFDVAQAFLLVDISDGNIIGKQILSTAGMSPPDKVEILKKNLVNRVLCGAISDFVQNLLKASNISVYPWNSGEISEVIGAIIQDRLSESRFCMPGCCQRRRRWGRKQN